MEITGAGSAWPVGHRTGNFPGDSRWPSKIIKILCYVLSWCFFAKTLDTVGRSDYISWPGLASQSDPAQGNVYL